MKIENEDHLKALVEGGALCETSTFDAKREVDRRPKEIAKDIAAMANDGGWILYGVAEDENGRLSQLHPFPLKGEKERISSIAASAVSEPLRVTVSEIPSESSEGTGYLLVEIPASPRAPHMVTVKNACRYYGRSAGGNRVLTEGEVARLYQRRRSVEKDFAKELASTVESAPVELRKEEISSLHLLCMPVLPDENLLEDLESPSQTIYAILKESRSRDVYSHSYSPDFRERSPSIAIDGWKIFMDHGGNGGQERQPENVLDLYINFNGRMELHCGRIADHTSSRGEVVFEHIIAGLLVRFIHFAGHLFESAGYVGQVDLGASIREVGGKVPFDATMGRGFWIRPQDLDLKNHARTLRCGVADMRVASRELARKLLQRFFRGLTSGKFDPLKVENGS